MEKGHVILQPQYQSKDAREAFDLEFCLHVLNHSRLLMADGDEDITYLDVLVRKHQNYIVIEPTEVGKLDKLELAARNLQNRGDRYLGYVRFPENQVQFSLEKRAGPNIEYQIYTIPSSEEEQNS